MLHIPPSVRIAPRFVVCPKATTEATSYSKPYGSPHTLEKRPYLNAVFTESMNLACFLAFPYYTHTIRRYNISLFRQACLVPSGI